MNVAYSSKVLKFPAQKLGNIFSLDDLEDIVRFCDILQIRSERDEDGNWQVKFNKETFNCDGKVSIKVLLQY